ncbi:MULTISPECIES: VanZ family protein [Aneurinibacillus]|jgi:glycopeptide antibiotics resistance protein|uniref:VanZ-like domain-containing protein n=1 Tax=Aneurinibacillus danicus TaxID=267746 RepID=A0A511VDE0_9BACL|nr:MULTISPECIES: VanZ family protein [Aneurinibacillus]GEN36874.1 hypothetical protein ADA01nite_43340 [Aneurinibacillus danicus]
MDRLRKYIDEIIQDLDCDANEREELSEEFYDHLLALKDEYMNKGKTKEEAEKLSIKEFGNSKIISTDLQKLISPYHKIIKNLFWFVFIAYSLICINKLFLSPRRLANIKFPEHYLPSYNLIPFKNTFEYATQFPDRIEVWLYPLFYKVLLFIPFGFLLPFLFRNMQKTKNTVLLAIIVSATIKTLQYITHLGEFDVNDMILNPIGALIGFYTFILLRKINIKSFNKKRTSYKKAY